MTCTHAALKRGELVSLGFKYDNILMEESAQILEIETFIPLLLQTPQVSLYNGIFAESWNGTKIFFTYIQVQYL